VGSNRDLGEKLLTNINAMLKEKDLASSDIKRIAAHKGPGHYSAVRTGVLPLWRWPMPGKQN